jgi:hypothetical protein
MARLVFLCGVVLSLGVGGVTQQPSTATDALTTVVAAERCDPTNFQKNLGDPSSCCQSGKKLFHTSVRDHGGGFVRREIGTACTMGDGSTHCGDGVHTFPKCYYGACRAHIIPPSPTGSATKIFIPNSNPQACGFQLTTDQGEVFWSPEPFTNQTEYPSVKSACVYTTCLGGRRPGILIDVEAVSLGAIGTFVTYPVGIKLSGIGKASGGFEGAVTLRAKPTGRHARVVFSGDCVKTGKYGKKAECRIELAPDPKVTVTYECQKGFTCKSVDRGDRGSGKPSTTP